MKVKHHYERPKRELPDAVHLLKTSLLRIKSLEEMLVGRLEPQEVEILTDLKIDLVKCVRSLTHADREKLQREGKENPQIEGPKVNKEKEEG